MGNRIGLFLYDSLTFGIVLAMILVMLPLQKNASANSYNWINSQSYNLSQISTVSANSTLPNDNCTPGKLLLRKAQATTSYPYYLSEQWTPDSCVANFPFGKQVSSSSVYIQLNGTSVAGKAVAHPSTSNWGFHGLTNSNDVFSTVNNTNGDGSYTSTLRTLSEAEKRNIKPIVLYRDGSNNCVALTIDDLGTIKAGQDRQLNTTNNFNDQCL